MKKFFGILFLIIGLAMIGLGIAALTNNADRNNSFEGRVGNEFSENYRSDNNEQQMAGFGLVSGGLIFFVIGLIMVVTKSSSQRKKDVELAVLKKMQTANISIQSEQKTPTAPDNALAQKTTTDEKFSQIEKLGELKEKGLLTDEEFQQQKKKILE